jgi:hypothetical protein
VRTEGILTALGHVFALKNTCTTDLTTAKETKTWQSANCRQKTTALGITKKGKAMKLWTATA